MAQILARSAAAYIQQHPGQAVPQVQSTLARLSLCRTAALGGHKYRCGSCDHEVVVNNSCGDRYCPTCCGARKSDWLQSTSELILDGIDYFQVVFTLPSQLSRLALGNRKEIYDLLFASAWSALKSTIHTEHQYDPAALMVLHTWNQKLDAHAHIHAVVPGCGLATDGSGVVFAQRDGDAQSIGQYLVDADDLRAAYRKAFLRGLTKLHQQDKLKLTGEFESLLDDESWSQLLDELRAVPWVSYIQPPPQPDCRAEHVLKYLAGYLAGGPISDSRIVATDHRDVTFMARSGQAAGGNNQQHPITLSQVEFTRRWSLHVLPADYTRTRRFGGWSNTRCASWVERLAIVLESSGLPLPPDATQFGPFDNEDDSDDSCHSEDDQTNDCPECGCLLIPHTFVPKPSWATIMASACRPKWYQLPRRAD